MNRIKTDAKPRDLHKEVDDWIKKAKQNITNATIDLPEYRTGSFRAMCLEDAIHALQRAHARALTQAAIENAAKR